VEAESNKSTVTLRVVVGDENGSIKNETVNMVSSPKGLGPEKDYAGKGQRHMTDLSSRQRGRPTKSRPQLPKSNKHLVMSPRWGSTPRLTY
jgi:hypothetical protein